MHSFQVNTTEIGSAATNIGSIAGDIETSVAAMMTALGKLETTWTGSASTSFHALKEDWKKTQDAVKEDLRDIGTALAKAGVGYADAETTSSAYFRPSA